MTNPSALLANFGTPAQIAVHDLPIPQPSTGQLLVRLHHAPINPADLNILEGKYGQLPSLPAIVGNEGAGIVEAVGEEVSGWQPGDRLLPLCRGTWSRYLLAEANRAVKLPPELPLDQASMLMVNPATALLLLKLLPSPQSGEWILQNASNSGVGRAVIQLAPLLGLRTLNIVRRPELIEELRALGGDVVLLEEDDLKETVKSVCGKQRPRLALNAVGGPSALNLANALANGGTLVTFGGMSKQPLKIPIGQLIFRDLSYTGFWLTRWLADSPTSTIHSLYGQLANWMLEKKLHQPIDRHFPLAELAEALDAAVSSHRPGKILLDL